jgi:hypothetical protein
MDEAMEEKEIKSTEENREEIGKLEADLGAGTPSPVGDLHDLSPRLVADEEILVTVLVAPMQNPEEVVQEIITACKKQKAQ